MKLTKNVENYLHATADLLAQQFIEWVIGSLEEFESTEKAINSPVEQLFFIEWYSRHFISIENNILPFFLLPQYQDESTGKYILDFKASFLGALLITNKIFRYDSESHLTIDEPKLGIEIDSHIWHERTKEQVQYDKQRERFLIAKGWKLLRFTGSEIYKNPTKCLDETIEVGNKMAKNWYKKLREFKKE